MSLAVLLSAAAFAAGLVTYWRGESLVDDSFMYVRYADHWLAGHGLRWNVQDDPTFGLTSPLYLLVVTPLRVLLSSLDGTLLLASVLSGLVFLAALAWLAVRISPSGLRGLALLVVVYAAAQRGLAQTDLEQNRPPLGLAIHFLRGMDTPFALAFVVGLIALLRWFAAAPDLRRALLLGAYGALLFFVRPDLLVFAYVVPGWLFLAGRGRLRWLAAVVLAAQSLLLGVEMLAARLYFGSYLPLPFFAKSTRLYGPEVFASYDGLAGIQFLAYCATTWLPLALILALPLLRPRAFLRRLAGVDHGLLLACAVFFVYYLFFVLQIMGHNQRFYYPTFPVLVYLAVRSLAVLGEGRGPPLESGAVRLGLALVLAHVTWMGVQNLDPSATPPSGFSWTRREAVYGIALLDELPDDFVLAGTEVGYIGARATGKRFVDLAGLHDTDFALHGFSASRLLEVDRPDLLYFPHPHYRSMIRSLYAHPRFREEYEWLRPQNFWDVALRRDSPYYELLRLEANRRNAAPGDAPPASGE